MILDGKHITDAERIRLMRTIEGNAAFDSHDYVSNLKPRYDNENTNSDASGDSDLRIDSDSAVSQLEGVRRDQASDRAEDSRS